MDTGFQLDSFQLTPLAFQMQQVLGNYPDPADVRQGVQYGPTGTEYTGTLLVTVGSGTVWMRAR